jgi:hypothetical protein
LLTFIEFEEGYVNSAFRIGMKPEFALLCGLHPDDKHATEKWMERWYIKTPAEHIDDLVRSYASMLGRLWKLRARDRLASSAK